MVAGTTDVTDTAMMEVMVEVEVEGEGYNYPCYPLQYTGVLTAD